MTTGYPILIFNSFERESDFSRGFGDILGTKRNIRTDKNESGSAVSLLLCTKFGIIFVYDV